VNKKTSTLQLLTFSLIAYLGCLPSFAQTSDIVAISPDMYQIDQSKKMILVNQDIAQINARYGHNKGSITLDKAYTFVNEVEELSNGKAYSVTAENVTYSLYFTQLPIIKINTKHAIVDDPRVYATFAMSEMNGQTITSNLGIEVRGGFSQTFPKKSYRIEFWEDTLGKATHDFSLLNMRSDDDWNLQAMYNEPMRVRSKSANELWQEVHQIYYKAAEPKAINGIKLQYAELFLNNEYKGLYAVGERVDNKQLQLKKYNDNIRGELYKGDNWGPATMFTDAPAYDNTDLNWAGFEYEFPDEVIDWKNLHDFVDFTVKSSSKTFLAEYKSKIHLKNAADYFIFLNLIRATDNVAKNVYIAKYKANEPYFFIPWDLDGALGTDWLGNEVNITNDILSNKLFDRLLQDYSTGGFRETIQQRWAELRASVITEENIMGKMRANQSYLDSNAVLERESLVWKDFTASSNHMAFTSTWVNNRLAFLDSYFNPSFAVLSSKQAKATTSFRAYPNPAQDFVCLELDAQAASCQVSIQNIGGKVVLKQEVKGPSAKLAVQGLPAGLYFITIQNDKYTGTQKLVIN
jgi:spore coat protein H